jgi:pSer/pThr/pTyr-binding forkhead associated (FHA) protein
VRNLALRWTDGGGDHTRALVAGCTISLGRDPECDVVFDDLTISRRHAEVVEVDGRVYLRHLSRTNPTYVNGRATVGTVELQAGDELWLPVVAVQVIGIEPS